MDKNSPSRNALAGIEQVRLAVALLIDRAGTSDQARKLALVHTKLDEARLWMQDAIGYDRG